MSAETSGWVWRLIRGGAKLTIGDKLVLLALADDADQDGVYHNGRRHLARGCGLSDRAVTDAFARLEEAGHVHRHPRYGEGGARLSDVVRVGGSPSNQLLGGLEPTARGSRPRDDGSLTEALQASSQPSLLVSSVSEDTPAAQKRNGVARQLRKPKYNGKPVPMATVHLAERLLATFNRETKRKLPAWQSDDRLSPYLRQIVGALLTRSHVEEGEWHAAVKAVVAKPFDWIKGRVEIGHIFGERAADHALALGSAPRELTWAEQMAEAERFAEESRRRTAAEEAAALAEAEADFAAAQEADSAAEGALGEL